MRLIKLGGLTIAAAATLAVGAVPAMARPHHDKPHHAKSYKVCNTFWRNHHRVTRCHWERR